VSIGHCVGQSHCLRVVIRILAQIESSVVHNVSLLHDIGTHRHVSLRGILAQGLKTYIVVWVRGGGKTLEHALLSQQEGADIDGEDCTLLCRVLLLELDIFGEQIEGLALVLEDLEDTLSTRHDENVEVLKLVVGILVIHISFDGETLDRGHSSRGADKLALEGLAGFSVKVSQVQLLSWWKTEYLSSMQRGLTLFLGILKRAAQDLERARDIERVVARKEGEQHLDRLNRSISAVGDCTHCE
jgi:hypothetical protein